MMRWKCAIVRVTIVGLMLIPPSVMAQRGIPGAVLYLDATEQHKRDQSWNNLGSAGGAIPHTGAIPQLKSGTIKIPDIEFSRKLQWYTIKAPGQGFAGKADLTPAIKLKDWTAEFLVKRNGPKWANLVVTPQFAGFHSRDRDSQVVRILMHGPDTGKFIVWIEGKHTGRGGWFGADKLGIDIGEKAWHWIALVFTSGKHLESYQNGKRVGAIKLNHRFDFDEALWPTIFHAWDIDRTFNGALALVRIYDRPLSHKEINQNITGNLSVNHRTKLAMTWAGAKMKP